MAPKGGGRGGGGGGGGSGGSSGRLNRQCRSAGAFSDAGSIVAISFMAIFLLSFLILSCVTPGRRKYSLAKGHRKARLQWCTLFLSVFCAIIGMILFIATTVMLECGTSIESFEATSISHAWFKTVSIYTLLAVIIVSVCKQMHSVAGRILSKLVGIAHIIYVVVLGIFMVAFLSFQTNLSYGTGTSRGNRTMMRSIDRGLTLTYDVLALVGTLLATASIGFAILRSSKLRSSGSVKVLAGILIPSSIILTLIEVGYKIHFTWLGNMYTKGAWATYAVLCGLFYTTTFVSTLYLVSDEAMVDSNAAISADRSAGKGDYSQVNVQHPLLDQSTEYQGHVNQQQQQQPQQGPYEPMRSSYNSQALAPSAPYYDASANPLLQQPQQPHLGSPPQYQQSHNPPPSQPHYG